MLADSKVMAMVAVSDFQKGKDFYGGTLGLRAGGETLGTVAYECGGGTLIMYPSSTAGQNQATSATWEVDDIDAVVAELRNKGIKFEHYDIPGVTWNGDIAEVVEGMKTAWFKDPDGNILAINCMPKV